MVAVLGGGGATYVVRAGAGAGGGAAGELDVATTDAGAGVDGESDGDALADESSMLELAIGLTRLAGAAEGAMQAAPPSTTATASPAAAPPLRTADASESREKCSRDLIMDCFCPPQAISARPTGRVYGPPS